MEGFRTNRFNSVIKIVPLLITIFLALMTCASFANVGLTGSVFDIAAARKKLDQINIELATQNLELETLKHAAVTISELKENAQNCALSAEQKLDELLQQESVIGDSTLSEYSTYLSKKKEALIKTVSECRLFSLRATDYLAALKETIHDLSADQLFIQEKPIWKLVHADTLHDHHFSINKVKKNIGLASFTWSKIFIAWFLILIAVSAAYILRINLEKSRFKATTKPISKNALSLGILAGISFCFAVFSVHDERLLLLAKLSLIPLTALFIHTTFKFVFLFFSKKVNVNHIHKKSEKQFTYLLIITATTIAIGILSKALFGPGDLANLILTMAVLPAIACGYIFCYSLLSLPFIAKKPKLITVTCQLAMTVYFLMLTFAILLGYQPIFIYLIKNALFTTLATIGIVFVSKLFLATIRQLNLNKGTLYQTFRYQLGVETNKKMPELILLDISLYLASAAFLLLALIKIWLPTTRYVEYTYSLLYGFTVANINIYPSRIIFSMVIFVAFIIFGRYLTTKLARKRRTTKESDTQVAIAALTRYLTFGFALLFSFLIAGVNMTGLAIIAGALSVGIGLGLQSIVNNFVSGLILLIEKPVKSGDRVIIDGVEGFIKKVRVRSTQVTTQAKEDVIIPNADLINKQVTNYMFRDRFWRVTCPVGVAYGSNVELVMKTLLEVAKSHPSVMQEPPNAPCVYFKAFGSSSLDFELWCIINDVNMKHPVQSELLTEIDRLFRKRNIVISFPQRDLHLKSWEAPLLTDNE